MGVHRPKIGNDPEHSLRLFTLRIVFLVLVIVLVILSLAWHCNRFVRQRRGSLVALRSGGLLPVIKKIGVVSELGLRPADGRGKKNDEN